MRFTAYDIITGELCNFKLFKRDIVTITYSSGRTTTFTPYMFNKRFNSYYGRKN